MFDKIVIFHLLICAVTQTNSSNEDAEVDGQKIHRIFDTTIKQVVRQFAEQTEPISSSNSSASANNQQQQQQQMSLTFINVAHFLKEIEVKVANEIMCKLNDYHPEIMNFHNTLSAISVEIQQKINAAGMRHSEKVLELFEIQEQQQEADPHLGSEAKNSELFHLLLTFAIRLGFTIGHDKLNDGRETAESAQIHLDKLVRAQNCMEQTYPYLLDNEKSGYPIVVLEVERVPTASVIKLNFNLAPGSWEAWRIQYNLDTIRSLLFNSIGLSIEGWMRVVGRIEAMDMNSRYTVANPANPDKPLDRLLVSWTGYAHGTDQIGPVVLCAFQSFGKNLAKRLLQNGSPKMEKYFAHKDGIHKKLSATMNAISSEYENNCSYNILKERMAQDHIKYEQLAQHEIFMHYEDAVPYNELMTMEEYKEICEEKILPMLREWQQGFAKCVMTKDGTVANCDWEKILHEVESCRMPRDPVGQQIYGFFRDAEFKLKAKWEILMEKFDAFDTQVKGIEKRKEGIKNSKKTKLSFYYNRVAPNFLLSAKGKRAKKQLKIESSAIADDKEMFPGRKQYVLHQLEYVIDELAHINWQYLLKTHLNVQTAQLAPPFI